MVEKYQKKSRIDYIIFGFLTIISFFIYTQSGDLGHTAGSSIAYLNGHFLDFYDYNLPIVGGNAYFPSVYLIYAIWNIPIRILNIVTDSGFYMDLKLVLWFKLLPVIFYFISAFIVNKILKLLGYNESVSKMATFLFISTPIAFFSQFIFSQYDIFTVFFMLIGIFYYFRKNILMFALFFGVSITFKYFSFLIFIPMLLLYEKNYINIIKYLAIALFPLIFEMIIYLPSVAFRSGVFGFGSEKLSNYSITIGNSFVSINLLIFATIIISAFAYLQKTDDMNIHKWMVFYTNCIIFILFGLNMWHPQWLLFATPFWVIGAAISSDFKLTMLTELLMMIFFVLFTVNFWAGIDNAFINNGVLGIFKQVSSDSIRMREFFIVSDNNLYYTLFSSILFFNTLIKHPFYNKKNHDDIQYDIVFMRLRYIGGILFFMIPNLFCFFLG